MSLVGQFYIAGDTYPERFVKIQDEIKNRPTTNGNLSYSISRKKLEPAKRIVLFLVATLFVYWGIDGYLIGEIAGRHRDYTAEDDSLIFHFKVLIYVGLGVLMMYFSLFGKVKNETGT